MVKLTSAGEVAQCSDESQFDGGSLGKCGFYAAANVAGSAAPGGQPWSAGAIITAGDRTYVQFDGPDIASNGAGMTPAMLKQVLATYKLAYKDINPDWTSIKASINAGYPVIICLPETQVIDVGVGGNPYPWDSTGIDHIILLTGIASDGNILARDSANIEAPNNVRRGPRTYVIANMTPYWATAVTPSWYTAATVQEEDIMIELNTPGVSQFWAPAPDGAWHCTVPGHDFLMLGNIRSFYVRFGNKGLCGVTYLGLPLTKMFPIKTDAWGQLFEHGFVVDDEHRVIDRPVGLPSDEKCYLGHVDMGQGQTLIAQPLTTPLNANIKSIEARLADTQTKLDAALKNGGDPTVITNLQAQVKTLQAQVAASTAKFQQIATIIK